MEVVVNWLTKEHQQMPSFEISQGRCNSCNFIVCSQRWHTILMTNGDWRVVCDNCYNKAMFKETKDGFDKD